MLTPEIKTQLLEIINQADAKVTQIANCDVRLVLVDPAGQLVQLKGEPDRHLTAIKKDKILRDIIIEVTGVEWHDIESKRRKREFVMARQLYMYFAYYWVKYSFKVAANNVGGRDHSTAIHSCNTVKDLVDTDYEEMKLWFTQIKIKLNSVLL